MAARSKAGSETTPYPHLTSNHTHTSPLTTPTPHLQPHLTSNHTHTSPPTTPTPHLQPHPHLTSNHTHTSPPTTPTPHLQPHPHLTSNHTHTSPLQKSVLLCIYQMFQVQVSVQAKQSRHADSASQGYSQGDHIRSQVAES